MKKTTKITLAVSAVLLVAVGYFASTAHVFRGCDLTETMTSFKVRESFKAPFYKFKLDVGRYPTTGEGIDALVSDPGISGWQGPYIEQKEDALDAWNRMLQYRSPGNHNIESYDLFSYGPDGVESDDDIKNWNEK